MVIVLLFLYMIIGGIVTGIIAWSLDRTIKNPDYFNYEVLRIVVFWPIALLINLPRMTEVCLNWFFRNDDMFDDEI